MPVAVPSKDHNSIAKPQRNDSVYISVKKIIKESLNNSEINTNGRGNGLIDIQRQEIKERIAILYQQRREINHQYNVTLNPDDLIKIKLKLDKNAQEIRDLEEQLKGL